IVNLLCHLRCRAKIVGNADPSLRSEGPANLLKRVGQVRRRSHHDFFLWFCGVLLRSAGNKSQSPCGNPQTKREENSSSFLYHNEFCAKARYQEQVSVPWIL